MSFLGGWLTGNVLGGSFLSNWLSGGSNSDWIDSIAGDWASGIPIAGDVIGSNRERRHQDWQRDWTEYTQKMQWKREDTAVQRRVADMEAAGINPLMAAGSAAETGSPVSSQGQAPERGSGGLAELAQMALAKAQVQKTLAEAERIEVDTDFKENTLQAREEQIDWSNRLSAAQEDLRRAEVDHVQAMTAVREIERELRKSQVQATEAQAKASEAVAAMSEYNLGYAQDREAPAPMQQSPWITVAKEVAKAIRDAAQSLSRADVERIVADKVREAMSGGETGRSRRDYEGSPSHGPAGGRESVPRNISPGR